MSDSRTPRHIVSDPELCERPSKQEATADRRCVQAYLDGRTARAFHKRCAELGLKRSEYARRLIRKDLNGPSREPALEERIEARLVATLNAHVECQREQLEEAVARILSRLESDEGSSSRAPGRSGD